MGLHAGIPFGNGRHGVRPVSSRPLLRRWSAGEGRSSLPASGTVCSEVAGHCALNLGMQDSHVMPSFSTSVFRVKNKQASKQKRPTGRSRSVNGLASGFWLQNEWSGKHI